MTEGPNGPVIDTLGEVRYEKCCPRCSLVKPLTDYYRDRSRPDRVFSWCKVCTLDDQKQRHAKNPTRRKELRLRRDYGVSLDEYRRRYAEQGGACLICREPCPTGKELAVDHDHQTGAVRGLLCAGCNLGLGNFRDDPQRLRAAAEYLETACLSATA